jgi:hypothetical protein
MKAEFGVDSVRVGLMSPNLAGIAVCCLSGVHNSPTKINNERDQDSNHMNLIKRLFSHQPPPQSEPSPFVSWPGQSGKEYQYEIYPIDSTLQALPGNFIYAKQSEDGQWIPLYIAQTRGMHQRLEGHEKLQDATELGATHIHVNFSAGSQAARCSEEHDLVLRWQPVCNEAVES